MSSAGINFGGLASGLDTQAIISALMAVERRPIAALQTKKTSLNSQKKLFGDFKQLLSDLQTEARALRSSTDFLKMAASSSNEDVLTVRASGSATPGTHQIKVVELASAKIVASNGRAANDTPLGDGTFFLDVGGTTHAIDIGAGTGYADTIEGIAQAIRDKDLDVTADVVDTGQTGNNRYQLVLRSTAPGSAGNFTLTPDTGGTDLTALLTELNTNVRAPATDALIEFNGIEIYRTSNSITDVIPGITLDLKSENANPVTVTVTTDAEETTKQLQEFVDAYNKVVDFVAAQNTVGQDGTARNPLFGDSTLRSIRSNLRTIVGGAVNTGNTSISMLANIGITSDREGKLTFSRSKFEEMLGDDEQAVAALFTGATTGIAERISTQIDIYTGSSEGLIKARQDGFDRIIKDTQRRIDQGEARLVRFELSLETRYANLESQLARLQGQGNSISSINNLRR